jgi:predicted RNA-binding protein with PIN domain
MARIDESKRISSKVISVERDRRFPFQDCSAQYMSQIECVVVAKHLLVDGANILHAWPELRALLRRARTAAQARLVGELAAIHDGEGVRVTVVFDGSGAELELTCPGGQQTFAVVRTPTGMTADDFIERWVGRAAAAETCWVATGDVGEGRTVAALGAQWISPEDLSAWVRRAGRGVTAHVATRKRNNDRQWDAPENT